jgi:D-galactose 1-dehydrogenase
MNPISIAVVGVGKIARDQHLPSIHNNPGYRLVAAASRHGSVEGVANFTSIEEMLDAVPEIEAVSLCMPPRVRFDAAHTALSAGKHVFLEKPPGATLSEVAILDALAQEKNVTLFTSWHSRFGPAVEPARAFLSGKTIRRVDIVWNEDVRRWHPNQDWIWEAGGLGVFDPGINALSIMTHILPMPVFVTQSTLEIPENRDAPIAAQITFQSATGIPVTADMDWRRDSKDDRWDIIVETDAGTMILGNGGARLSVDGVMRADEQETEYPTLYARFHDLVRAGRSEVDVAPLRHIADIFMLGSRKTVEAFHD